MFLGGVDEAGRGSAIGPLVIAGVSFEKDKIEILGSYGVNDSKTLSPKTRQLIYPKIIANSRSIFICKIKPNTIDSYVQYKKLNILETRFMTFVSDSLVADKIIFDACDVNLDRFKNAIFRNLKNKRLIIYCFHKADQDNIVVAAASILAKVTRDREVSNIESKYKVRVGSGYPSDPLTKSFLTENVHNRLFKEHIRFSWAPVKLLMSKQLQSKLI